MKKLIYYLIFFSLLLSSCNTGVKKDSTTGDKILPGSIGGEYEVLIVGENITNRPDIIEYADSCFHEVIPALPQIEYWYRTTYLNIKDLNTTDKRHANILFLSALEQDPKMNNYIKENIPELEFSSPNEDNSSIYKTTNNIWAEPQLIVHFVATDMEALKNSLWTNKKLLLNEFDANDKARLKKLMFKNSTDKKLQKKLSQNHMFSISFPKNYELIKDVTTNDNDSIMKSLGLNGLVWLRGESKKSNNNILVYYTDFDKDLFIDSNLMNLKNKVCKELVHGENKGSYMSIEERYDPIVSKTTLNGHKALELRGLWKMNGDFMGGPFLNYAINDVKNNRLVYIDAFIFAPGTNKKKFLKRLEIILSTFKI